MARALILLVFAALLSTISAVDFVFNGFSASDLILLGNATVAPDNLDTDRLSLTKATAFAAGRAFHKTRIKTRTTEGNSTLALPFSTSFLFSIAPVPGINPGHGITLMFSPSAVMDSGVESQQIGLFNFTTNGDSSNGVFAIELDVFENAEFEDIDNNHVGIDLYSLTSKNSSTAGYWSDNSSQFSTLKLNDGSNYQLWVDYDGASHIDVTMSPAGVTKPRRALVSLELDLSDVFRDEMYVGFSASTGALYENHRVLGWSFSNDNFSIGNALITSNLPNFVNKDSGGSSTVLIAGFTSTAAVIVILLFVLWIWVRRMKRRRGGDMADEEDSSEEAEDWELEYWPHRIGYKKLCLATNSFSDENLIGSGRSGKVYKGLLTGSTVAVKVFTRNTGGEERGFLAEVSILGRLKHRNLVGLKGWCRRNQFGDLMLVYEYMSNGSLDKKIFSSSQPLNWSLRVQILKEVAAGVLYLHEGWECRVLHRDIKSSNVMLDGDMVGRLGDFGLARIQGYEKSLRTTQVVGTVGYMAPEIVLTGTSTSASDVYGFGVLILEIVCGRRPIDDDWSLGLIEWAWEMIEKGDILDVVDKRAKMSSGYDAIEASRLVRLGLVCTCSEAEKRPTIRKVARALDNAEEEGLNMEVYLAEKLKTVALVGRRGTMPPGLSSQNQTFEELKQSWPPSAGLSDSDLIMEGR